MHSITSLNLAAMDPSSFFRLILDILVTSLTLALLSHIIDDLQGEHSAFWDSRILLKDLFGLFLYLYNTHIYNSL